MPLNDKDKYCIVHCKIEATNGIQIDIPFLKFNFPLPRFCDGFYISTSHIRIHISRSTYGCVITDKRITGHKI